MGVKVSRQKQRNILLSMIYRLQNLLPFSSTFKLKLFLDLEWIFDRLSHELSFKIYKEGEHPIRLTSEKFILKHIKTTYSVLDLGCNTGYLSNIISDKAKSVVGIDHDNTVIAIAKQKHQKKNLIFYNREALDFLKENENNFDVLILSHILEHIDNPKDFILKFKCFFKYMYIEVPDFDRSYLNLYRQRLGSKLIYTDNDHVSEFDRVEIKSLLEDCNLVILEQEYRFGVQKFWCSVQSQTYTE